MADWLASSKRMMVPRHSFAETSVVADESGIHKQSCMKLVEYARAGVSQTSSLTGQ